MRPEKQLREIDIKVFYAAATGNVVRYMELNSGIASKNECGMAVGYTIL